MARERVMVPYGQEGGLPAEFEHEPMNPGFDPGQVGADEMSDDLALLNTLAQIGVEQSEAKVNIYQINAQKKDVFLYSCSVGEFGSAGLEEIQSRYGAGEYRIRVYNNGRVLTHRRVEVGAPRELKAPMADPAKASADLAGMFAQQTSIMMEGFKQIAEALKSVQTSMPQQSRGELLQDMIAMKQLIGLGEARQETPPMQMMLDMLRQGMELGRMGGGEPSSLDILSKAVDTFAPVVSAVVAAKQAAPVAAPVAAHQATLPQPVQEQPAMTLQLKMALGFLVRQARANADPYTYACMVVDQVPAEELNAMLSQVDWKTQLAQFEPGVQAPELSAWFDQLRVEVMGILTAESETGITAVHADPSQSDHQSDQDLSGGNPGGA